MSRVSYEQDKRDKAKELKRPLFTVDVPGARYQGVGDDELVKDLFAAMKRFQERQNARKQASN